MQLAQHTGEWYSLASLKENGRIVDLQKEEIRAATKKDCREGAPVIFGNKVIVIFLYDHVNLRFFCEEAFASHNRQELVNAFMALQEAKI